MLMAKPRTSQGKEDEWIGPKYTLVHGIRVPTWALDPNFAEDLERFQTRKDDVFVASYPKSGLYISTFRWFEPVQFSS